MSQTQQAPSVSKDVKDFLPINGTDFIEFYVGNAKQAAHYYRTAFGFKLVAYAGLETGVRDKTSYVLQQDKIRFVLTTPLIPEHSISDHIKLHGDGVRDIALWVDDAESAYLETTKRGGRGVMEPTTFSDEYGELKRSSIGIYGDTIHSFIERKNYKGPFMPGYKPVAEDPIARPVGLKYVDHCVGNVELGAMNTWVEFYMNVMGFRLFKHFDDKDISTEYSALMSKVMANGNDRIKFPINEPAAGKRKSQIEEYLEYYRSPGVQHIAMAADSIIDTVGKLTAQGVEFLRVPTTYYAELQDRVGKIDEPIAELQKLGILVDRDEDGYLLQIFTKPVEDRPTLFFEVIQRKGSKSFGKGNFKALFEAIEREQASRGNL
ncbi:MAG TPA: 4-hydroxyphenylpyruvate dioxygenase [Bacteroidota bacterium]|jgi:4-hydroxyphenylpyruvate dioxygenase|nr:4-hydroxyphenylpyruvate dioxygenase [Bacteroidota bacterium]